MVRKTWSKEEVLLLISYIEDNKSYNEISLLLNRTKMSIFNKIKKLKLLKSNKWTKQELEKAIILLNGGKSFKQIGELINKSYYSVSSKLNGLGYKSKFCGLGIPAQNKGKSKYINYDWKSIQKKYDDGLSYDNLLKEFKLSSHAIIWAKKNGMIKMKTNSEGLKLAWSKGKYKASSKKGIERYRQLCEFKFSVKKYPEEFDLKLIQEHGWYKASNRGNNLGGVSRDHIISVKFGFENGISPEIISHPANCRIMRHADNQVKNSYSGMSIDELEEKIKVWNEKYSYL